MYIYTLTWFIKRSMLDRYKYLIAFDEIIDCVIVEKTKKLCKSEE